MKHKDVVETLKIWRIMLKTRFKVWIKEDEEVFEKLMDMVADEIEEEKHEADRKKIVKQYFNTRVEIEMNEIAGKTANDSLWREAVRLERLIPGLCEEWHQASSSEMYDVLQENGE